MCGFQVGDEVVCVDNDPVWLPVHEQKWSAAYQEAAALLVLGAVYTISEVTADGAVILEGVLPVLRRRFGLGYAPSRFRKVQRRDLSAWLKTATKKSSKWDKREKAPA